MHKTKRKKLVTLTRREAIRRLDRMVSLIERDVEIALQLKSIFQTANGIVQKSYKGGQSFEAHCYNGIINCVAINLALTLARLFEPARTRSRHANKRDVASLPALVRLLQQKRCRKVLMARARDWTPDIPGMGDSHAATCEKEIDAALAAYAKLKEHKERQTALAALKEVRDKVLAHSLFDAELKYRAFYQQLFYLAVVAREITTHANFAIDGRHRNLRATQRECERQAEAFWKPALAALFEEEERERSL